MNEAPFQVLVVDDQPQNRTLAAFHLKALGCAVSMAATGIECLDAVAAHPPDLILLDVMMPGMDGFEVCRRLKAHKEYRHIPIVLLTSLQATDDRVTGIEAGADDFISKPFNRHELMARVRSLLRVKRLEEKERLHFRRTFERYVDSAIAQRLLDEPDLITPAGRRQDASILFADVRGFTAWSEKCRPEVVVEVINLFLTRAVEIVLDHGGAIDKFTGDGLMAHFGALIPTPDHPRRAVASGLEIVSVAAIFSHADLPAPLRVGCGINSGEVVVGNVGSERRSDYTVIGDAVNVASRLTQEATGGQVLVSRETWARLGAATHEDMGLRRFKNRSEPVHTYSVTKLLA